MVFSKAIKAKEYIIEYRISMRVTLKYVKNKLTRVRVKCAKNGCPFVLMVSKDGSNPSLTIKIVVEKHNHQFQLILTNEVCNTR